MKNSFENTNSRKPSGPILPGVSEGENLPVINDPRYESLGRAQKSIQKNIDRCFKGGLVELTKSVEAWEYIFNIREEEGLFDILKTHRIMFTKNPDGTVTIKK